MQASSDSPATAVPDLEPPRANAEPRGLGAILLVGTLGAAAWGVLTSNGVDVLTWLFSTIALPPLVALAIAGWAFGYSDVRWVALFRLLAILAAMCVLIHFAGEENARPMALLWGVPAAMLLGLWCWRLTGGWRLGARRNALALTLIGAMLPWLAVRGGGQQGFGRITLAPRWQPVGGITVAAGEEVARPLSPESAPTLGEVLWPGFRGPNRDGVALAGSYDSAALKNAFPLRQLWKQPIGAGWSSFAVVEPLIFTQEQRGEFECVVAYDFESGKERWVYADQNRFNEMAGGLGPRATPTFADGRLYVMGPSGILTCVDASTGRRIWRVEHAAGEDETPQWGFAGSPLVHDGLVFVALEGINNLRLAAFDIGDGKLRWRAFGGADSYSSPQLATLAGVRQVLIFDGAGLASYDPASGNELWSYEWKEGMPKVAQPMVLGDSEVLIGMGYGRGLRLLEVKKSGETWTVGQRWASDKLKPKFNDFVIHEGHAYGLDEGILACVSLKDGKRAWKGGRYGYGQVLLAPPYLLVVSEAGEVALVDASPAEYREVAKSDAIRGKTWNHPVIAAGRLLVRNGDEVACFDLRKNREN